MKLATILFGYWAIGVFVILNDMLKTFGRISVADILVSALFFWVIWPIILFVEILKPLMDITVYRGGR